MYFDAVEVSSVLPFLELFKLFGNGNKTFHDDFHNVQIPNPDIMFQGCYSGLIWLQSILSSCKLPLRTI